MLSAQALKAPIGVTLNAGHLLFGVLASFYCVPQYAEHVEADAFGIIGLFIILQAWINLFEVGAGTLIMRRSSLVKTHNNEDRQRFFGLLRGIELLVGIIVLLLILSANLLSSVIVWVVEAEKVGGFSTASLIILIVTAHACRLPAIIHRSGVMGLERHGILSLVMCLIHFLRYVGGLLLFSTYEVGVWSFLCWQIWVSIFETLIFAVSFYISIKADVKEFVSKPSFKEVRLEFPFLVGILIPSFLGVLTYQIDRAVLMGVLTLPEIGYLGVLAMFTSGFLMIAQPFSNVFLPKLTRYHALSSVSEFELTYSALIRMLMILGSVVTAFFLINSESVFAVMSLNADASEWLEKYVPIYLFGALAVLIFGSQYQLQIAHGDLRLHNFGSVLNVMLTLAAVLTFVPKFGMPAAAAIWVLLRWVWGFTWASIVHWKIRREIFYGWLIGDIAKTGVWVIVSNYLSLIFVSTIKSNISISLLLEYLLFLVVAFSLCIFSIKDVFRGFDEKSENVNC